MALRRILSKLKERRRMGKEDSSPTQLESSVTRLTEGKSGMGGGGQDTDPGVLLKRLNAKANKVGRDTKEGKELIAKALKLRRENPKSFRRGVNRGRSKP